MAEGHAASFYRHAWVGLGSIIVLLGGLGIWAAATDIAGAVVAGGTIAVEGGSKRVQHREGGIVSEILVQNEDAVETGELLIRLDGTATAANLAVIVSQLSEAYALQARLTAESIGAEQMVRTNELAQWPEAERLEVLFAAQDRLRSRRAATQVGLAARLGEQVAQLEVQIEGLEAQRLATGRQLEILVGEQADVDALLADGLVEAGRVNSIKREVARLQGEQGRLLSEIAAARTAISERRLQITQAADEFQTEVLQELQAVGQKIAELQQQKIAAEDVLSRLEVRAPQAGVIHESITHTVGGVVGPGETLMLVVPQESQLIVEARVGPLDVDKLAVGQGVVLRLSGFDARTTPELSANVERVSPDLTRDPVTGEPYYAVKVRIGDGELSKLSEGQRLVPGMPAEAFIQTGERSVLSYLIHPLVEQINRTFRED